MDLKELLSYCREEFICVTVDSDGEIWVWTCVPDKNKEHWFIDKNKSVKGNPLRVGEKIPGCLDIAVDVSDWENSLVKRKTSPPKKTERKK